jgi:pyruvate dehydrogenase E2 component (dihydrolipoamide acetyltransferase)
MSQTFHLPDLGEGLTEAELLQWRVSVGDTVTVDQVVAEVETAKALVEVPVPYSGTVMALHAAPGDVVDVGAPLISVATPDRYREEEQADSGNVLIGYGTGSTPTRRRRRAKAPASNGQSPQPLPADQPPQALRVISPLVRNLAREHGLRLETLKPTAPDGIIRRRDVEAALTAPNPTEERLPLRGTRRMIAEKLSRSRAEIPDATTWVDVDATGLVGARTALNAAYPDRPVSLLALLARISVAALLRFPDLNSSADTAGHEIIRYRHINLGFAAQTDHGLLVPVIRDAHTLSTTGLNAELARLTGLARAGNLPPRSLTGGTFTLNNYGVFGVDGSTPIINHPEAAILGVGRIVDKPWVVGGELQVRKVTQLSLTFDHRVCDGAVAGGFLRYVADCVENPAVLLAEL